MIMSLLGRMGFPPVHIVLLRPVAWNVPQEQAQGHCHDGNNHSGKPRPGFNKGLPGGHAGGSGGGSGGAGSGASAGSGGGGCGCGGGGCDDGNGGGGDGDDGGDDGGHQGHLWDNWIHCSIFRRRKENRRAGDFSLLYSTRVS